MKLTITTSAKRALSAQYLVTRDTSIGDFESDNNLSLSYVDTHKLIEARRTLKNNQFLIVKFN